MHGNHFGNKNTAHSMLVCMCACTHGHTLSRSIVKLLRTVAFKVVREASGGDSTILCLSLHIPMYMLSLALDHAQIYLQMPSKV